MCYAPSVNSELKELLTTTAAEGGFTGVARVDEPGAVGFGATSVASGLADRAWQIPNTTDTIFGLASITKGFTALAIMSLVNDGVLSLNTTARSLLSKDLPLVDDDVTIEHLLTHTSGIGDYVDESVIDDSADYILDVPTHALANVEDYLPVLANREQISKPGTEFQYNNSGYALLAVLAQRASGIDFYELVHTRVFEPAGMQSAGFLRMDELPSGVARGYLHDDGLRTNVLHLPVRGTGDGGCFASAADLATFWDALYSGRIVPPATVNEMTRPRVENQAEECWYGLGFYTTESGSFVWLEGFDAGIAAMTGRRSADGATFAVLANKSSDDEMIGTVMDYMSGDDDAEEDEA